MSASPTLSLVEVRCGLCGADDFDEEATGFDFEYATAANEFRFVRCRRCDHRYLNPRPSSDDLGVIYTGGSPGAKNTELLSNKVFFATLYY